MGSDLYLARASRFVSADPIRGIKKSDVVYSGYKIVVALNSDDAEGKFLNHLKENTRSDNWEKSSIDKLIVGTDVPLAKRLAILGEICPIIQ